MRAIITNTIAAVLLARVSVPAASVYFNSSAEFLSVAGMLNFDSVEDLVISDGPVAMLSRPGYALTSDVSGTAVGGGYGIYAFHFPAAFGAFATD